MDDSVTSMHVNTFRKTLLQQSNPRVHSKYRIHFQKKSCFKPGKRNDQANVDGMYLSQLASPMITVIQHKKNADRFRHYVSCNGLKSPLL